MRVYVFGIRGFPWVGGGAEKHCEELYPRLVKMGYDVTVLTRKLKFYEFSGVKFKQLPYINNRFLETMSHSIVCSLYCLKHRPDKVHIHNMGACLLVPLLTLCGINTILTIHSLNYHHYKWGHFARFVLNFCENLGINFAEEVITVSNEVKNFLWAKYDRAIPIHYISNGVNEPKHIPPGLILKKYGLEPKKYVLAVGRLSPEKELDKLIQAYRSVPKDYKLVIVGNSEHKSTYDKKLFLERDDNVKLTGFLCGKDLAELYSNAGLFVSASSSEGFPLVVLEALSYGLPILVSDIPAHREVKLPKKRYFAVGNIKELSLKIDLLISEGIDAEEKKKYQEMMKLHYDWDAITRSTQQLYG